MRLLNLNNIAFVFFVFLLNACSPSPEERINSGFAIAENKGWQHKKVNAGLFDLTIFTPENAKTTKTLYVYIEGDGQAWQNKSTPSRNPTPKNNMALSLAMQHGNDAIYIARPCQYQLNDAACSNNKWWTSHRFAPEIITATSTAIDKAKQLRRAENIILIGYSGGGAVALLTAAERNDVIKVITVAGNLDINKWVELKKISPLSGSLNPADKASQLVSLPQVHFVGGIDKIVPPEVANSYVSKFPDSSKPSIITINNHDHNCCWAENWQKLMPSFIGK